MIKLLYFLLAGEALVATSEGESVVNTEPSITAESPSINSNGTQNRSREISGVSDQSRNGQHVDEGKKIYSVSFASNMNSLIPQPPKYILCGCCDLCSLYTDRKNQHCNLLREGNTGRGPGKCFKEA